MEYTCPPAFSFWKVPRNWPGSGLVFCTVRRTTMNSPCASLVRNSFSGSVTVVPLSTPVTVNVSGPSAAPAGGGGAASVAVASSDVVVSSVVVVEVSVVG